MNEHETPLPIYQRPKEDDTKESTTIMDNHGADIECIATINFDESDIENGVFSYLGLSAYDPDEVEVSAFPKLKNSCDSLSAVIGVKQPTAYCITESNKDSAYSFRFQKLHFHPTHYALKNYWNGNEWWNTGWVLEGSRDDGQSFEILHKVTDSADLKGRGKILVFKLPPEQNELTYYQLFRVRLSTPLGDPMNGEFGLSGFELWGKCGTSTTSLGTKWGQLSFSKLFVQQLVVSGYVRRVHQEYGLQIADAVQQCILSLFKDMVNVDHRLTISKVEMDGAFGGHSKIALQCFLSVHGRMGQLYPVDGHFGKCSHRALHWFLMSMGYDLKAERFGKWGTETTKMLQRFLKSLGFGQLDVDGHIGRQTTMHLQAFLNSVSGEPEIEPVCD